MPRRLNRRDRELVEQIHAYLDLAFLTLSDKLGDSWTYREAAELSGLSHTTIRNLHRHEGNYAGNSLTLANLGAACGLSLAFVEGKPRVKLHRAA